MKSIAGIVLLVVAFSAGAARADHPTGSVLGGNWSSPHGEYFFHDIEAHGNLETFHFTRKTEVESGMGIVTCVGAGVYDRETGLAHSTDACPSRNRDYVSHSSYGLRLEGGHPHLQGVRSEQWVGHSGHGPIFHEHPHEHYETISKRRP